MLLGFLTLTAAFLLSSHFLPWVAFQQELMAAAAVALIGGTALTRAGGWRWPFLAVAAALAASVPLLQAASGLLLYAADGLLASLYLLGFALCIATGAALVQMRRDDLLDGLAAVMLTAALVSVGLAACQWLLVEPPIFRWIGLMPPLPGNRPFGNLGQPNHLATLLAIGVISVGWFFERRRVGAGVLGTTAVFLSMGIALTQSRQIWVGLVVVSIWMIFARRRAGARVPIWALPAFTGVLVVMTLLLGPLSEALQLTATRSVGELAAKGTRLLHWQHMLDAIGRAPWFGYGWNGVNIAQSLVAPDHPAVREGVLDHSHNMLLDLMVWNGVPLGLLMFGVLVWWFARHLRACADAASTHLLAVLLVVFTHAAFEYPLSYAYFLLPAGLMMGAVDALSPVDRGLQVPRALAASLVALAVLMTSLIAVDYVKVDADHRKMRLEKFIVSNHPDADPPVEIWLLTNWRDFLVLARSELKPGMPAELLESMRKVRLRYPQPPILIRYALVAGLNDRPDEARAVMSTLCKMHAPLRCREGRDAWLAMREKYPQLPLIEWPPEALARPSAAR
jgi:O-antigen ligase